jgi:excisionase family DNA binding protein
MQITIKTACSLLGVSRATLYRRLHSGELQCSRTDEGTAFFTPEHLSLTEAQVTERLSQNVVIDSRYEDVGKNLPTSPQVEPTTFSPRPLTPYEQKQLDDLEFAEKYKAGNACDSFGNSIKNAKVSLLGPVVEAHAPARQFGDSHMVEGLKIKTDSPPSAISSDEFQERWHPGQARRMDEMREAQGFRKPSQQERKQALDSSMILAAMRQGYSR